MFAIVLATLGELCSTRHVMQDGLLLGLFAAGAAGSIMHCGPMCGAFVLGQVSERMARLPIARLCEFQRIRGGLLLPYHLGRLSSYAGLGALAGGSGALFRHAGWLRHALTVLLMIAALLFLLHAVGDTLRIDMKLGVDMKLATIPRGWGRLIGRHYLRRDLLHRSGAVGTPAPLLHAAGGVALLDRDAGHRSLYCFDVGGRHHGRPDVARL